MPFKRHAFWGESRPSRARLKAVSFGLAILDLVEGQSGMVASRPFLLALLYYFKCRGRSEAVLFSHSLTENSKILVVRDDSYPINITRLGSLKKHLNVLALV